MEKSDLLVFFDEVFNNVAIGMAILNAEGRFIKANSSLQQMLGYSEAELKDLDSGKITYPEDFALSAYLFKDLFDGNREQYKIEKRYIKKNGQVLWVNKTNSIIRDEKEELKYSIITVEDFSKRKDIEEALIAEKKRLAITLESIGEGVIVTDTFGNVIMLNKIAGDLTGWTQIDALGQTLDKIFYLINDRTSESFGGLLKNILSNGRTIFGLDESIVLVAKDGIERFIAATGAPIRNTSGENIGVVLTFRDISERKKMDQELLRAQKLESIGILAGGIAHDFNNVLTSILANVQLAKMLYGKNKDITKNLSQIEEAINRATALTKQLLTFSKGGVPVKKAASVVELIKETSEFALRGSNVKCEYILPEDLWAVEIDEGQISQVINNLIINADQAMPEGGIIKVAVENIIITPVLRLPLSEGKYIKISVTDSGVGIPEALHQKIFDPYFTTKEKGNGLGLSTSYSIIKKHDGYIDLDSIVGAGATFNIYLPVTTTNAPEKPCAPAPQTGVAFEGKGKILIMDDESEIRTFTGEILTHLGYGVELAKDGQHAIYLYKQAIDLKAPYDVVIMDLTIPGGMGAKETIKKLTELDPQVKAIVSSGYTEDPVIKEYRDYGFSGVVTKPYKIEELSKILHKVLSESKEDQETA